MLSLMLAGQLPTFNIQYANDINIYPIEYA